MNINALPHYDQSINTTGCCPKFNPEGWDAQELHFENKEFVRATTVSLMHIPINMGPVLNRVGHNIENANAHDPDNCIVLSRDISAWKAEHLFSVSNPVAQEESVSLSGDFITKVFEGPYHHAKNWHQEMKELARARGGEYDEVYFFYTSCPKCAKAYGRNYIVGVARI